MSNLRRDALRRKVRAKRRSANIVTRPMTKAERYKAGYRDTCDICGVKNGKIVRGKKTELWSFTVAGAKGKIFNRCRRHLKVKVRS